MPGTFTVDPSAQVLQAVNGLKPAEQQWFPEILSILSENPFLFRDVIQKHVGGDGRVFYTYYDGILPLVFTYRIYPPEADWRVGMPGLVSITKAGEPSW